MLELEANSTDDPAFLDLASRLIVGVARANNFSEIVVVHIDHWFGERWLGFCGKYLGAAGVRSRDLNGELTPPPFHPRRVLSARQYRLSEQQVYEYSCNIESLHSYRTSQSNINRTFRWNSLYVWYSGDTTLTDKGVVMVYSVKQNETAAWYTAFNKTLIWQLEQTVAVSPNQIRDYIERTIPAEIQA